MNIKIFTSQDINLIEKEINDWFSQNPEVAVQQIVQSESGDEPGKWSMTLTILYEPKKEIKGGTVRTLI